MKISTNSRYAIRFLAQLASEGEAKISTASIAGNEMISEKMLERIAAKLKNEGYVRSSRGLGGGYELAIPANEITVAMILKIMETPYLPLHCNKEDDVCRVGGVDCKMHKMMTQIDKAISSVTENITIEDLIRE